MDPMDPMDDDLTRSIGFLLEDHPIPEWLQQLIDLHSPGCPSPYQLLDQCSYCFRRDALRQPSHSPPRPRPLSPRVHSIQARQSSSRTYAEVARARPTVYQGPAPPTQPIPLLSQEPAWAPPRHISTSAAIRASSNPTSQRFAPPTYAQVAQISGSTNSWQNQPYIQCQQNQAYPHGLSQDCPEQGNRSTNAASSPRRRPPPSSFNGTASQQVHRSANRAIHQPSTTTQSFPSGTPLIRLNDEVPRQAFPNPEPRNIADLVQATSFRGHRSPPPSTRRRGSSLTTPLTPRSPSVTSSRTSHSNSRRRTGAALRDPSFPYPCITCETTFAKQDDLRRHMNRTHGDLSSRPHKCSHCPWAFINPKDLRRHEEVHLDGERQRFTCPVCSKTYTRSDNLQRHIAKKHVADSAYVSMSRTVSSQSQGAFSEGSGFWG